MRFFDIKYHVIWITKYRYKVLRGRIAERARDIIRQICQAREVAIVRGAVSPDHIHMLLSAPPQLSPAKAGAIYQREIVTAIAGRVPGAEQEVLGAAICGREGIFARRWVRSTRQRSRRTSRTRNGMKTIRGSRSPRPPSLEPALSRGFLGRLQPQSRLSVEKKPTGFSR